jgi:hypothetical protein
MLRSGRADEALRQLRDACDEKDSSSRIIELGVAHLWVENYIAAWEHFCAANERYPNKISAFYEFAGVAKWCLGEFLAAVDEWRMGLTCEFADSAGGARLPLLLFVASVLKPGVLARTDVEKLLTVRADDRRVRNWPGPVVQFVLGRIDETAFRAASVGRNEVDTLLRNWRADFYLGILEYVRGNTGRFRELMRKTANTTDDDFDLTKRQRYLRKLWHAEFFIARNEAGVKGTEGDRRL